MFLFVLVFFFCLLSPLSMFSVSPSVFSYTSRLLDLSWVTYMISLIFISVVSLLRKGKVNFHLRKEKKEVNEKEKQMRETRPNVHTFRP